MKWALFLIVCHIYSNSWASPNCRDIFQSKNSNATESRTIKGDWISNSWRLFHASRSYQGLQVQSYYSEQTLQSVLTFKERIIPQALQIFEKSPAAQYFLKTPQGMVDKPSGSTSQLLLQARQTTREVSDFLKGHYPRRRWDEEFTESKVTHPDVLDQMLPNSYRATVYSADGKIIANGSIIYRPLLKVKDLSSGENAIWPWLSAEVFFQKLMDGDLSTTRLSSSRLPVENFFNFNIKQNHGLVDIIVRTPDGRSYEVSLGIHAELASFAVDKGSPMREKALEELYYEFILASYHSPYTFHPQAFNTNLAGYGQARIKQNSPRFFTYGDSVGRRLYRSKPFEFNEMSDKNKTAYGVEWKPLFQDALFLKKFARQKSYADVAKRAFATLFLNGRDISEALSTAKNQRSEAQEMADIQRHIQYLEEFISFHGERNAPLLLEHSALTQDRLEN